MLMETSLTISSTLKRTPSGLPIPGGRYFKTSLSLPYQYEFAKQAEDTHSKLASRLFLRLYHT
jgi:hypothetical protein